MMEWMRDHAEIERLRTELASVNELRECECIALSNSMRQVEQLQTEIERLRAELERREPDDDWEERGHAERLRTLNNELLAALEHIVEAADPDVIYDIARAAIAKARQGEGVDIKWSVSGTFPPA